MRLPKPTLTKRGSFFRKSLALVLLITCLPVSLIGIVIYYAGNDRIVGEVNGAHQIQLHQSIQRLDDYLTQLELYAAQLGFNPEFDESLASLDFARQFQQTNDLIKTLRLMKETSPLIDSVYLYLKAANKLIGDSNGVRTIEPGKDRSAFADLLAEGTPIYWLNALSEIDKPDEPKPAVVVKLPGGSRYQPFGAFVIYINQNALNQLVQKLTPKSGVAFLIDDDNSFITTLPNEDSNGRKLANDLRSYLRQQDRSDARTSVYEWNGQSFSLSYGMLPRLGGIGAGWTYVTATPLTHIMAPVTAMSKLIVMVSSFGLLVALLLAWLVSNKIYDPIRRLTKLLHAFKETPHSGDEIQFIENEWKHLLTEKLLLQDRLKEQLPAMRGRFLLQLLQGNLHYLTESDARDKMKQLDWDIEGKAFAIIVAQLHGISATQAAFSDKDKQLATFAASNIMTELFESHYSMVHLINAQGLCIELLVVLDNDKPKTELKLDLTRFGGDFVTAVNNVMRMKTTLVVSKMSDFLVDTPGVLEQTRSALRFRDPDADNQLLDMDDFMLEGSQPVRFPYELERKIVHAISIGLEDEAVKHIREFVRALQSDASTELMVHQGMMKLLGSIFDVVLRAEENPYVLYEGAHLYERLLQINDPEEMVHWFQHELIRPFIQTITDTDDRELKSILEQVIRRIDTEYAQDVSIEAYAEEYKTSPYKLRKAIKQATSFNFIDLVTQKRLDRCKQLLVTTDLKVNDIAEQLGYQPSYLIRVFKKGEGMTPGQYREKMELKQG
ncbi:AraC family transcriptional regulator [Paenibacillus sp. MBLB4367]|uniref:AraC family transcriptional regulator n=1 Tax=Paenibacillus sp. MBLB4367 TaxID=3384767 RepID=UPI0039081F4A